MCNVTQKPHKIYVCAIDIAHSGIQKPEERQPTYRGFKDLMIESWIQKPHCAVDVAHCEIQNRKGRCAAGFKNRMGGILKPHIDGFKNLMIKSGIQKPH